jgi:hypothetical protein
MVRLKSKTKFFIPPTFFFSTSVVRIHHLRAPSMVGSSVIVRFPTDGQRGLHALQKMS